MKRAEFARLAEQASDLVERGAHDDAIAILRGLVESDLPDTDRAMMALNLAFVCDKAGDIDQAIAWFDKGEELERPHAQFFVTERKAIYLEERGRHAESAACYERLLERPDLSEEVRSRFEILSAASPLKALASLSKDRP